MFVVDLCFLFLLKIMVKFSVHPAAGVPKYTTHKNALAEIGHKIPSRVFSWRRPGTKEANTYKKRLK